MKHALVVSWTLAKVILALALVTSLALYLRRFDPFFAIGISGWTRIPGLLLLISGGVLVMLCGGILSTRGILSSEDPLFPKEFVAWGPFRYVRNPMSLGIVVMMFGLGLCYRSSSMLLFAAGLWLLLHLVVVYFEEPGLEKRFGASYRGYKDAVNRWLLKLPAQES